MSRSRTAVPFLIALLAGWPVVSSAETLDYYGERIDRVTRELVATVRPTLDPQSQQLLDDIEIKAPLSWETNARTYRGFGNRRVVEFNAGLLAVTDWLSLAMIADWAGHGGCLKEYSAYLAELVGHNSRRRHKGKERKHINDFYTYASSTRGQCEGALQDTLDVAHEQELREDMLDAVIATVVLHEIAHHVLNHTSGYESNFMINRIHETDADRWAIKTAVDADYELRAAVPLFLFLALTGGGTLEDDIRSSHLSGLSRVRDLLVQTRSLLDVKDPVGAHMLDISIDDLNRSLR